MKGVIYARVSNQNQSNERQTNSLMSYAKRCGLEIVKVFSENVSGFSTSMNERKELIKMLDYINKHDEVNNIVISEVSRLGRNLKQTVNLISDFQENGICLWTEKEGIKTLNDDGSVNSHSTLLISIMSSLAQASSEATSFRVRQGRMNSIMNGRGFTAKAWGYKNNEDRKTEIDDEQATDIRMIFKLACQGMGTRTIANFLNSKDYTNEFFPDKIWKTGSIHSILKNSLYMGLRNFGGKQFPVPPIVSREDFELVNEQIVSRRFTKSRINTNVLSGKIFCRRCKSTAHQIVIKDKNRNVNNINLYRCANKDCIVHSVNRSYVISEIRKSLEVNFSITGFEEKRERLKSMIESNELTSVANLKEISTIERRLKKLKLLYLDDDLTSSDFNELNKSQKSRLITVENENKKIIKENEILEDTLKGRINHFSTDYHILKEQVKSVIDKVEFDENLITVHLSANFPIITIPVIKGPNLLKYNNGTLYNDFYD